MRLSEAILLGSTLSVQGFNDGSMTGNNRCALGAATQALGIGSALLYSELEDEYPWLRSALECPDGCGIGPRPGISVIWHLNDRHLWTRERIAEWVSTIEPPEESANADSTRERAENSVSTVPCGQESP